MGVFYYLIMCVSAVSVACFGMHRAMSAEVLSNHEDVSVSLQGVGNHSLGSQSPTNYLNPLAAGKIAQDLQAYRVDVAMSVKDDEETLWEEPEDQYLQRLEIFMQRINGWLRDVSYDPQEEEREAIERQRSRIEQAVLEFRPIDELIGRLPRPEQLVSDSSSCCGCC